MLKKLPNLIKLSATDLNSIQSLKHHKVGIGQIAKISTKIQMKNRKTQMKLGKSLKVRKILS